MSGALSSPVDPPDFVSTDINTAIVIPDPQADAFDPTPGQTFTVSTPTTSQEGVPITVNPDGSILYNPVGFFDEVGRDQFRVESMATPKGWFRTVAAPVSVRAGPTLPSTVLALAKITTSSPDW